MPAVQPIIDKRTLFYLSQTDVAKRLDPNGSVAIIAEVLTQNNDILLDIPYFEGNLPVGHRTTIRTGLPKAYWKRMNQGVPSSYSSVAQVEETCGICEARSRIDVDTVNLNGQDANFRRSEDKAFIESMNQTMVDTLFYGDSRNTGDGFIGLSPRYCTLDPKKALLAKNVIDCGGTADKRLTSIWIIGWGENTIFGFYPKGTAVGLQVKDKGVVTVEDEHGYPYEAYETIYRWQNGLVVKDWRYAVRLCNIPVDDVIAGKGIGASNIKDADTMNLLLTLNMALAKFPTQGTANICIYMNSDMHAALNVLATRCNTNVVQIQDGLNVFGVHSSWTTYLGYPMRRVDAIRNDEKKVS